MKKFKTWPRPCAHVLVRLDSEIRCHKCDLLVLSSDEVIAAGPNARVAELIERNLARVG